MTENELATDIIGASIEVHKALGPGLLESAYETALHKELEIREFDVKRQHVLPVTYKGAVCDEGYRIDLFVNDTVIIELKAVEKLNDIHVAQVLTYLKLSNKKLGLLINFNVPVIKSGIRRVVNHL